MALLTQSGEVIRRRLSRESVDLDSFRDLVRPLREVERSAIETAMVLCRGNQREAARRLGISAWTLRTKIRKYREGEGWNAPKYARRLAKAAAAGF